MTLYRQLLLCTLLTLVGLGIGLWLGELKRTRDFLASQLESHAQDTATSLGLSLSTLTAAYDIPAMESMINALFDRGYYRQMQLRDLRGAVLIDRSLKTGPEEVPAWFVRLVPLATPTAEALLMHGWQQTGIVRVESHPGYAYRTLWKSARTAALGVALTALLVAVLGGLGLRRLLRPLAAIEQQALALCERQFTFQDPLPRTRELRRVAQAMNRMTERIRELFDQQAAIADKLAQRTFQDPLTGAGNRRFLEAQVKTRIEDKGDAARGVLLLFQVEQLQAINQESGYVAGDQLLVDAAERIRQACADLAEPLLSRLGGGDFALLLPNVEQEGAARIAAIVLEGQNRPDLDQPSPSAGLLVCGGVVYDRAADCTALMSRADTALSTARYQRQKEAVLLPLTDGKSEPAIGRSQWKNRLTRILSQRSLVLYAQPIVSHRDLGRTLHHELLTRVVDHAGNHLSVGLFIPMAEQLGLIAALDRLILEQAFALPLERMAPQRFTLNLSPLSLTDPAFLAWLRDQLARCRDRGIVLNIEFPEFRVIRHRDLIRSFAGELRAHGHAFGIDHFGQGLIHFGYLKSLLPDYVKIDRAITNRVTDAQSDNSFFISSLCTVAHSLDIRVMAEGIETEQQWQTLSGIPLDAVQGYFMGRPGPIEI